MHAELHWLFGTYIGILGAALGSFLNVVIARLPAGTSLVRPGSHCPRCGHAIAWYDNIPIVSWILLATRCRHCQARISARYPIVELLMAVLAVALWLRFGLSWELLLWLPLVGALLAITFLDIDHWWIPDVIVWPGIAWAALGALLPGGLTVLESALGVLPAGLLWVVAFVFERVTGREGLGFGDIKLLALLGLAVGPAGAITILFLAAVQGSVIGIFVVATGGHHSPETTQAPQQDATDAVAASADSAPRATNAADEPRTSDTDMPRLADAAASEEDETWTPHPRAIPFGPFLVLGTFELVLMPQVFADLPARVAGWLIGVPA